MLDKTEQLHEKLDELKADIDSLLNKHKGNFPNNRDICIALVSAAHISLMEHAKNENVMPELSIVNILKSFRYIINLIEERMLRESHEASRGDVAIALLVNALSEEINKHGQYVQSENMPEYMISNLMSTLLLHNATPDMLTKALSDACTRTQVIVSNASANAPSSRTLN